MLANLPLVEVRRHASRSMTENGWIVQGMPITGRRSLHRTVRAGFPHTAPTSGAWRRSAAAARGGGSWAWVVSGLASLAARTFPTPGLPETRHHHRLLPLAPPAQRAPPQVEDVEAGTPPGRDRRPARAQAKKQVDDPPQPEPLDGDRLVPPSPQLLPHRRRAACCTWSRPALRAGPGSRRGARAGSTKAVTVREAKVSGLPSPWRGIHGGYAAARTSACPARSGGSCPDPAPARTPPAARASRPGKRRASASCSKPTTMSSA